VSYHEHNEAARTAELIAHLEAGESVALVSDAGTPLVSDPGYRVVRAAIDASCRVVAIPGASAVLAALAASGLPTDAFRFSGFLPAKQAARRKVLLSAAHDPATIILFEAPHRILETLTDIEEVLGPRPVVVARELTKLHEEFLRGTAKEVGVALAARPSVRGEITLLIGKGEEAPVSGTGSTPGEAVAELERTGVPRKDAIKQVARERGLSKRDVYREVAGPSEE
jgi:16S rRNA (cytidine1402-2'-O)-methyltransferase